MAATLPSPKSPVVLGLLGIGALWLITRRAAAKAAIPTSTGTQAYHTPTAVAGTIAAGIVALTKNLATTPDPNAKVTPQVQGDVQGLGYYSSSTWARDLYNRVTSPSVLGDPLMGWSGPAVSSVDGVGISTRAPLVDSVPVAPVYDLTDDFVNNPWSLAAP